MKKPSPRKKRIKAKAIERSDRVEELRQSYSLEQLVTLTGLGKAMILEYHSQGLVVSRPKPRRRPSFDDEALRVLRQIAFLRSHYAMDLPGVKLTLRLQREVEELRTHLRS